MFIEKYLFKVKIKKDFLSQSYYYIYGVFFTVAARIAEDTVLLLPFYFCAREIITFRPLFL